MRRLADPAARVRFTWEGAEVTAAPGETIAAALLAAGVRVFRETPARRAPRGPYCMMGACYDCLVEVDGQPARQACMTAVREGMVVTRQRGASAFADE